MKIERQENSIRLIPETRWEEEALRDLKKHGVDKIEYEHAWDERGYLQLNYPIHPWDRR